MKLGKLSKIKNTFGSRKFKGGAYTTIISVVVMAIVLLINIIVTELDIQIDVTADDMYTLSDTTTDYLKNIEDNVTIYYLVEAGNEDAQITEMINKYDRGNVKVEYKDPVLNPQFASSYVDDTITQNSIIVVNETNGKAKYVDYNNMFVTEIDYNTFQQSVTGIDVEGQVTSAIQYVTAENLPVMYVIEGHGESNAAAILTKSLEKENVSIQSLNTLTSESIPKDCSLLLINAPKTDYTKDEVELIKDYLTDGGDAIFLLDYTSQSLENISGLLEYYGIGLIDGVVVETDSNHYMGQYVNNLVPDIESHTITSEIRSDNKSVVVPAGMGLEVLDTARSTIEVESLLTTSDRAFSKTNVESTSIDKEEGDIDGPFTLGLALTETYNDIETKIVVYGSPYLIEETMISHPSLGNLEMFLNSINYVAEREESLAISSKNYGFQYLYLTGSQVYLWGAMVVIIIPVIILAAGGFMVYKRRRK